MRGTVLWAMPVLLLVGCNGGGAQEAGPVPTVSTPTSSGSTTTTASPPPSSGSTSTRASEPALCSRGHAAAAVASQEGAAGTIRTVWTIQNTGVQPCRSFGYPGMDFRTSGGWLDVRVGRGGMQDIDDPPARVIVPPGGSLYFVSYWGDVDTGKSPCQEFHRVKVTLPDDFVSLRVASSGCLNPRTVRVGPVESTPPA